MFGMSANVARPHSRVPVTGYTAGTMGDISRQATELRCLCGPDEDEAPKVVPLSVVRDD